MEEQEDHVMGLAKDVFLLIKSDSSVTYSTNVNLWKTVFSREKLIA